MITCPFEDEIVRSVKSDAWTGDLRTHAQTCPLCSETTNVVEAVGSLSRVSIQQQLPSPRLLWLKAQYGRRQDGITKLDLIALIGMALVGIVLLGGIVVWRFPKLFIGFMSFIQSTAPDSARDFNVTTPIVVFFLLVLFGWFITHDADSGRIFRRDR